MRFYEKVHYQRNHERLLLVVLLVGVIALAVVSRGCAEPKGHLQTDWYTVQSGDTLNAISYRYMQKSSVRRDVREFREGIIEANYDRVFNGRYPHGLILPGDKLQINYWVAE